MTRSNELLRTAAFIFIAGASAACDPIGTPSPLSIPTYHPGPNATYNALERDRSLITSLPDFIVPQTAYPQIGIDDQFSPSVKKETINKVFSEILKHPLEVLASQFDQTTIKSMQVHIRTDSSVWGYAFYATHNQRIYTYAAVENKKNGAGGVWVVQPQDATLEEFENGDIPIIEIGDGLFVPMFRTSGKPIDPITGMLQTSNLPKDDNDPNRDNYNIASNNYIVTITSQLEEWLRHRVQTERIIGQYALSTVLDKENRVTGIITEINQSNGSIKQFSVDHYGNITLLQDILYHPQPTLVK